MVALALGKSQAASLQGWSVVVKVAHQPDQLQHGSNGTVRTLFGWPASSVLRTSAITVACVVAAGFYFRHQRRQSAATASA